MVSAKTLKLDMSFRPIEIIDAVEALVLCLVGKAQAVETHMIEINSVNNRFHFKTMSCKRHNIIWRDQNQCQYCGNKFCIENLTIDHIIPRSKGGKNTWKNLVAACKKCNQKKGDKTPEQANMVLIRVPYKPKTNILRNINKNQIIPIWKDYLWENYD